MRVYRLYRMKESARQQFRWAPHVSGSTAVKRKEYEEPVPVEAANEYAAWRQLRQSENPLAVGDVLETEAGELLVCKYVGFEPAAWWTPPPPPPAADPQAAPATPSSVAP
jgi:hypothetical protein